MTLLEEIANNLRLLLTAMQMTTHGFDHLRFVGRPTFAQRIGLHVLVEQFVGIELGAISGQPDQAKFVGVGLLKGKNFGKQLVKLS